jgi:hypothetical protein
MANQTKVGLLPGDRSVWYKTWFDPREDVLLDYKGTCFKTVTPPEAHFITPYYAVNPAIITLIPKKSIRQEAERQVQQLLGHQHQDNGTLPEFVSVHRRMLEGNCYYMATTKGSNYCVGSAGGIKATLQRSAVNMTSSIAPNYTNVPMVLLTDGQAKELDGTFPLRANSTFQVEAWMMTLSVVHIGNPVSSVDNVVNHWRRGKNILPSSCYYSDSFQ